jgi:hypothetical protein
MLRTRTSIACDLIKLIALRYSSAALFVIRACLSIEGYYYDHIALQKNAK